MRDFICNRNVDSIIMRKVKQIVTRMLYYHYQKEVRSIHTTVAIPEKQCIENIIITAIS